jgi:hypothetical protein
VSPCARTDRHTEIVPAPRSTCSHVSARASSDRTPVSRHSTMNACSRDASAASSSAEACVSVSDCDGRPSSPPGVSTSADAFRRTRSCPSACQTARVRHRLDVLVNRSRQQYDIALSDRWTRRERAPSRRHLVAETAPRRGPTSVQIRLICAHSMR